MFKTYKQSIIRFWKREDGVTAVECALLLALVVTICIVAITPMPNAQQNFEPTIVAVAE